MSKYKKKIAVCFSIQRKDKQHKVTIGKQKNI